MKTPDMTGNDGCKILAFPVKKPVGVHALTGMDGITSSLQGMLPMITTSSMMIKPYVGIATRGAQVVRVDVEKGNLIEFDELLRRVAEETTDPGLVALLEVTRAYFKSADLQIDPLMVKNLCPEVTLE